MADKGDEVNLDVAASPAVLAGIAASDALCGKDDAQYAPKTMGVSSAKAAVRQAADLVGAAKSHP